MRGRGGVGAVLGALGAILLVLPGCDGGNAGPPSGDAPAVPVGVPEVVVLLPAERSPELRLWDLTLQAEAGRNKRVVVTIARPESESAPPSRQADLAREAAARAASGVIAVPGDPAALGPALQSLREQGVAVVVLGDEVPVAGSPLPRVATTPLDRVADELVARAREVAKAQDVDPDGPAAIIAPEPLGDRRITPRVEALTGALKRAGVPVGTILTYRAGVEAARPRLETSRSESNPARLIFAVEDAALLEAASLREERVGSDDFIVAGFADERDVSRNLSAGAIGAVVLGRFREQAVRALDLALSLIDGQAPPDAPIEITLPIRVTTRKPTQVVYRLDPAGPAAPQPPETGEPSPAGAR